MWSFLFILKAAVLVVFILLLILLFRALLVSTILLSMTAGRLRNKPRNAVTVQDLADHLPGDVW